MSVGLKSSPLINPICNQMGRYCPDVSEMKNEKGLTLVCKSVGI